MSKAIETLMNEHRLIERVLGSLRTFAERLHSLAEGLIAAFPPDMAAFEAAHAGMTCNH